jgi:hypothetical protein
MHALSLVKDATTRRLLLPRRWPPRCRRRPGAATAWRARHRACRTRRSPLARRAAAAPLARAGCRRGRRGTGPRRLLLRWPRSQSRRRAATPPRRLAVLVQGRNLRPPSRPLGLLLLLLLLLPHVRCQGPRMPRRRRRRRRAGLLLRCRAPTRRARCVCPCAQTARQMMMRRPWRSRTPWVLTRRWCRVREVERLRRTSLPSTRRRCEASRTQAPRPHHVWHHPWQRPVVRRCGACSR